MKSRVFTNIAGVTIVATAEAKRADSAVGQGAVLFTIIRDQDETDLQWSISFATYADARGAIDHIEQPLLEEVVSSSIEFSDLVPF